MCIQCSATLMKLIRVSPTYIGDMYNHLAHAGYPKQHVEPVLKALNWKGNLTISCATIHFLRVD